MGCKENTDIRTDTDTDTRTQIIQLPRTKTPILLNRFSVKNFATFVAFGL